MKILKLLFAAAGAYLVFRIPRKSVAKNGPLIKSLSADKRGPARQYTDEERKERHRLAQQAYETRERSKRGEPAPLPYKDKLNLGVGPARDNRQAYNQAYYLNSKKTGNQKPK
jgi:hypothetical protein